ncbi:biopolymer transporter ExbD [Ferrovum sp.]|jgi:biopolymer transport protein ExbD|uniref:ExbD/TolR family protein n=1 Tax=Ferrovum sp. TaxID=2609467 RepID=UPI0026227584|nr:biopolymer transporter ExbD [Ferrovum sp.]
MNFRRGWREDEPEVNLIPMIDVLLVVLIFLMISTQFRQEHGMELQLPLGGGGSTSERAHEITLAANGRLQLDGKDLGSDPGATVFAQSMRALRSQGDATLVLAADARIPHGQVMAVLEALRSAGFHRLRVRTRPAGP